MDSVVKIFTEHSKPNFSLPWTRERQQSTTGSGFLIKGPNGERWVLTNAHAVDYHSQVRLKHRSHDHKFTTRVLAIGRECDIALFTVDDGDFWEGLSTFVSFGGLPDLHDAVHVVGFPIGGDTVSVTSGVVSRIEVIQYIYTGTQLLAIQIDAAINPGNSGGPAFGKNGECVGVAFQALGIASNGGGAQNIGYIIPTPVVQHFLDDYQRNGTFTAFPTLALEVQPMESDAMRAAYQVPKGAGGVLVRTVHPMGPAAGKLEQGDVLLRLDDVPVASDATVPFRTGERISFVYLLSQKIVGDKVALDVLRKAKQMAIEIELTRPNLLVPVHFDGRDPPFLLVAGVVFTVLSDTCKVWRFHMLPYLGSEFGENIFKDTPIKLQEKLAYGYKHFPDEQVVILAHVLASAATCGYERFRNMQVVGFNRKPVRNLTQLAAAVRDCQEPYMAFDFGDRNQVLVLDTAIVGPATTQVLMMYHIPSAASTDILEAVWTEGGSAGPREGAGPVSAREEGKQLPQEGSPAGGRAPPTPPRAAEGTAGTAAAQ